MAQKDNIPKYIKLMIWKEHAINMWLKGDLTDLEMEKFTNGSMD
jgi:hypothetical protein